MASETPEREFRRKAAFDLWVHQNSLFWSRFPLLGLMQTSYFAVAAALKGQPKLVFVALGLTLSLMIWLYSTVDQDRELRNHHEAILRDEFGYDLRPAKLATVPRVPVHVMEVVFQLTIFVPFAVVDLLVAVFVTL